MSRWQAFERDAASVSAMRLERSSDMSDAFFKLRRVGLSVVHMPASNGVGSLVIYGGPGSRTVAQLGDWLTLDERTGAFSVEADDEGKPIGHRERGK